LAGDILEAAKSLKVTDMITLAAFRGRLKGKVVGAASDPTACPRAREESHSYTAQWRNWRINGLLAGMSPLYGIRGYCILGPLLERTCRP